MAASALLFIMLWSLFSRVRGITSNGIASKDTLSRLVAVVQQGGETRLFVVPSIF